MKSFPYASLALASVFFVSGCASTPQNDREHAISSLQQQGLEIPDTAPRIGGQLSRHDAVQAALYYHPSLQKEYARLDIAAADVVRASELLNPSLSLSWLKINGGGSEFSIGLSQSLAGLMLRPARQRMAAAEHELALQTLAEGLRQRALDTEAAWYELARANQVLRIQEAITRIAVLADELAQRFDQAGNMTPLERARHARAAAEAQLDLVAAYQRRDQARTALALQMALPHERWRVGAPLPAPANTADAQALLGLLAEHPLIQQQHSRRQHLEYLAGERRKGRWLDDTQVGIKHERSGDERATGPTLGFRIPLWHRSRGERRSIVARQQLIEADIATLEDQLPRQLEQTLASLAQQTQRITLYQQALLPALAAEVDARQARVNFMLEGVFTLLASKRDELRGWQSLMEALGDYWQQEVALARLIGSTSVRSGGDPIQVPLRSGAPIDHSQHPHPAMDAPATDNNGAPTDQHRGHH